MYFFTFYCIIFYLIFILFFISIFCLLISFYLFQSVLRDSGVFALSTYLEELRVTEKFAALLVGEDFLADYCRSGCLWLPGELSVLHCSPT